MGQVYQATDLTVSVNTSTGEHVGQEKTMEHGTTLGTEAD